jgi:putative ABC transport system ATP-binding protein
MMNPLIVLERIRKSYRLGKTEVRALRDLDLVIQPGEFTALSGPSGSGKTTLLNIIGCIDKPDTGRLVLGGEDVTPRSLNSLAGLRRERLGYIFQSFNLIPVLTAYENVEYPLLLTRMAAAERRRRVEAMLERVGLADKCRHNPGQLSGGQRQRIAIARALVTAPAAVLADEPTANLDSLTSGEILDLMEQLNRENGTAFLFATHDPRIVAKARRVVRLLDGTIVADAPAPMAAVPQDPLLMGRNTHAQTIQNRP